MPAKVGAENYTTSLQNLHIICFLLCIKYLGALPRLYKAQNQVTGTKNTSIYRPESIMSCCTLRYFPQSIHEDSGCNRSIWLSALRYTGGAPLREACNRHHHHHHHPHRRRRRYYPPLHHDPRHAKELYNTQILGYVAVPFFAVPFSCSAADCRWCRESAIRDPTHCLQRRQYQP